MKDLLGGHSVREDAHSHSVSIMLQTADKTRLAQVTVPRRMRAGDLVKIGTKRWSLAFGIHYQVANLSTGKILLAQDNLTADKVRNGDTLMLQPLAMHGSA